jgi:epoxyqueuosine reductase QueG
MTDEQFSDKSKGSAAKRAKRRGLLKNTAAALSGRDDQEAIATLAKLRKPGL